MAFYNIHPAPGLDDRDYRHCLSVGPPSVGLRRRTHRQLLEAAGFTVDVYEETPGWPEPMTAAYAAVLATHDALVREMGEAAVAALSAEMSLTLERKPYKRRVFAAATRR